ncbi:MAG: group II truncated hemoglobin [bacterium]
MADKDENAVPTLLEWAGGTEALERLTTRFYERVLEDPLLRPLFEHMSVEHPRRVAHFLAEVLGGPPSYSEERGGHSTMVSQHLNRGIKEEQRQQWLRLLLATADEVGLPTDPEFRSAFVSYLEWGSRLAVINSAPGAAGVEPGSPMPKWGWGEVKGPYRG